MQTHVMSILVGQTANAGVVRNDATGRQEVRAEPNHSCCERAGGGRSQAGTTDGAQSAARGKVVRHDDHNVVVILERDASRRCGGINRGGLNGTVSSVVGAQAEGAEDIGGCGSAAV